MITAIVQFKLPDETTLEDAKAIFEGSVAKYEGLPGLVRKYYLFGEGGVAGGVYLWQSREAADAVYTPEWRDMIKERYGAAPQISFFDTPVIVDNAALAVAAE